ncbi:MAG: stage III sporulation AC/AD family protein [Ruminococcus sp.]|jgi:stage III sporulation protein AD|nr:stage III sporulation AC/AD family protein [Ruminococcus sp.]
MNIISVCGFCIASVIACKALENDSRQLKTVLTLVVAAIFLLSTVGFVSQIISAVSSLFDAAKIDGMYIKVIFKCLGVTYLTQFAADYCKDCGENAIASQVLLAGRISVLVISLPLFKAFVEIVKSLII